MKTTHLIAVLGLSFIGLVNTVSTVNADTLDRGTALDVVVARTVQMSGTDSAPVLFRVVTPGPLASATLEGRFTPKPDAWVLTEFEGFVLPNGLELPLGKVKGSDAYGTESIEVLQSDRDEWAAYVGKSVIPAGTHFNMMLTTSIQVPSFNKASLALNR